MDTIPKVAVVAEERVFMGSLDDRSGFHNLFAHDPRAGYSLACTTTESTTCAPHSLSVGTRARCAIILPAKQERYAYLRGAFRC